MKNIDRILPNESVDETMNFIEAKRNWAVKEQKYKFEENIFDKVELSKSYIYQRGQYIILEYNDIVHYWEMANTNYPYFQMAISFLELNRQKKWKTIGKLIDFRQAIRETEAGCTGYVESILYDENGERKRMTHKLYAKFMALARAYDLQHHGDNTF